MDTKELILMDTKELILKKIEHGILKYFLLQLLYSYAKLKQYNVFNFFQIYDLGSTNHLHQLQRLH